MKTIGSKAESNLVLSLWQEGRALEQERALLWAELFPRKRYTDT